MSKTFDYAFDVLIGHEGAKLDLSDWDSGNWTGGIVGQGELKGSRYGISAAAYPNEDIANLTADRAKDIYKRDYWVKVRADELPAGLALVVFDSAVNNGNKAAIRFLQLAVGANPDGAFGPATMAAVKATIARQGWVNTAAEVHAQRINFMANLATWKNAGLGWSRRLAKLPFQAVSAPPA